MLSDARQAIPDALRESIATIVAAGGSSGLTSGQIARAFEADNGGETLHAAAKRCGWGVRELLEVGLAGTVLVRPGRSDEGEQTALYVLVEGERGERLLWLHQQEEALSRTASTDSADSVFAARTKADAASSSDLLLNLAPQVKNNNNNNNNNNNTNNNNNNNSNNNNNNNNNNNIIIIIIIIIIVKTHRMNSTYVSA